MVLKRHFWSCAYWRQFAQTDRQLHKLLNMHLLIPDSFLYINFSVNTVTAMFVVLMSTNADAWIHRRKQFQQENAIQCQSIRFTFNRKPTKAA